MSRSINRTLIVKFDINFNLDEPTAIVESPDGDILALIRGDNAEDLYDWLLGEEEY